MKTARFYAGYLAVFAATAAVLVAAGSAICFRAIYLVPANQTAEIVQYQKRKIAAAPPTITTIFVGDSSLGNSLDAKRYAERTGEPALNLALTGVFGYEGSYNMIKAAAARFPLKKVVVIQTTDMLTRTPWPDGYVYTAERPGDFTELRGEEFSNRVSAVTNLLLSWRTMLDALNRSLGWGAKPLVIENDYPRQAAPLELARLQQGKIARPVRSDQLAWLSRIRAFCAARGIGLVYLHGPLNQLVYDKSGSYVAEANAMLAGSGVRFDPQPLLLPPEKTGDAFDHVRPGFKEESTDAYIRKIDALR